ncbi:hypothetical protein, partial [Rhizobium wenxiniae]|uniref:hypothetical protein n=1 Tax=Rhizobium wenxiniae TaxID=1737357 RepID=UPI001AEE26D8
REENRNRTAAAVFSIDCYRTAELKWLRHSRNAECGQSFVRVEALGCSLAGIETGMVEGSTA